MRVFAIINSFLELYSCFHILVKGTSSSSYRLFAGAPLVTIASQENFHIHAYAIRAFHTITKVVDGDGIITETPSFNNIFDSIDFIEPNISSQLKQLLVPITAEEFYNLDDMK